MAVTSTFTGMGTACSMKCGSHIAVISRINLPLEPSNFQIAFWFNNGVDGVRLVDGFRTSAAAQEYASSSLTAEQLGVGSCAREEAIVNSS